MTRPTVTKLNLLEIDANIANNPEQIRTILIKAIGWYIGQEMAVSTLRKHIGDLKKSLVDDEYKNLCMSIERQIGVQPSVPGAKDALINRNDIVVRYQELITSEAKVETKITHEPEVEPEVKTEVEPVSIDAKHFIALGRKLLSSENPAHIVLGIMFATSRRVVEAGCYLSFEEMDEYTLRISTPAKKMQAGAYYEIPTLIPASEVVENWERYLKLVKDRLSCVWIDRAAGVNFKNTFRSNNFYKQDILMSYHELIAPHFPKEAGALNNDTDAATHKIRSIGCAIWEEIKRQTIANYHESIHRQEVKHWASGVLSHDGDDAINCYGNWRISNIPEHLKDVVAKDFGITTPPRKPVGDTKLVIDLEALHKHLEDYPEALQILSKMVAVEHPEELLGEVFKQSIRTVTSLARNKLVSATSDTKVSRSETIKERVSNILANVPKVSPQFQLTTAFVRSCYERIYNERVNYDALLRVLHEFNDVVQASQDGISPNGVFRGELAIRYCKELAKMIGNK